MLDWVIRGGTVIDGSGGAPFRADIGIRGGKIAAVGSCGEAAKTLDAAGRYVTPGFLDIHRHGDAAVFRPGFGRAELRQGLTSIVNGNCGLSLAPFGAAHRAELRRYLGAITGDIDPAIPTESMAAYLDALRARPLPLHVGMLVGGGTVRADCCGYAPGDADEALPELHRRLERALADGALGVSLGLGYAPECFYTPDGLLRALAPLQGSGVPVCVHMREEGDMVCEALREMLRAARLLRTPVHISHLKAMGPRNWNRRIPEALSLLAQAREEGLEVSCDVYPYCAGSTQLLHLLPQDFLAGGTDAVAARLRDPTQRDILRERIAHGRDFDNIAQMVGWDNIRLTTLHRPEFQPLTGKTLAQAAELLGMEPVDCLCHVLAEEACNVTMIDFITCDEDIGRILRAPFASVISDSLYPTEGLPHPRVYGTFTRILETFVRERHVLTLPEAVQRMTSLPAQALRLQGKGRIAAGMDADVNVIPEVNPEDVKLHHGIIASANCSTIITVTAVNALNAISPIRSMVASTYQAVSGAGAGGPVELAEEVEALRTGKPVQPKVFSHQIAYNLIPQIGGEQYEGYTSEEMKMQNEGRKIMHLPDLRVTCTCVRVPVVRSHSISVILRFDKPVSVREARHAIAAAPGCRLVDDLGNHEYPMPLDTSDQDLVYVGRIRPDLTDDNGLTLWCCGDQIRKGAATNTIQVAELLIEK